MQLQIVVQKMQMRCKIKLAITPFIAADGRISDILLRQY